MRLSNRRPTLLVAVVVALLGGGLLQWASKEAERAPAPGSGAPVAQQGGNHIETTRHSANVQAAGDYHVEAQLSAQGELTLYIYGAKEKQLFPIPATLASVGIEAVAVTSGEGSQPIALTPRPLSTDPKGMSSRFVGRVGRSVVPGEVGLSLTLPLLGQTYRLQWRPEYLIPGALLAEASMPAAVGDAEAQKLFLTSGGLYTAADIAANGRQTATQKYGSQMSQHNAHPQPGERLCPISETAASPKFAWIVGGKTYLFCCPPCIEEFVKQAKEKPKSIKKPESYVKR